MKRTISIILLLLCVLAASAQIQRKFLGITLGASTKAQVYEHLMKDNYEIKDAPSGGYVIEDVTFAGYEWHAVMFAFYDETLYSIAFFDDETVTQKGLLNNNFKSLKSSLLKKYFNYFLFNSATTDYFSDNTITITLNLDETSKHAILSLHYFYKPLLDLLSEEQETEL